MSVQLALPVRAGPRSAYPTGLQVPCAPCAAAGVDRLGMPRETDEPLCVPCWQGRQQRDAARARNELRALLWHGLGDAAAAAVCELCDSDIPSESCACGWLWLAELRAQHEAEQAAAAAAERDELQARFAYVVELGEAEDDVRRLAWWVDRCRTTIEAAGTSRGRAVDLTAAALAQLGYARGRGRPPAWPRVAAVLALAADYRSGRRARPGRAATAALAGCTEPTVTDSWRLLEDAGWCERTVQGRLATLDERVRLGTHRIRAQFDVAPLRRWTLAKLAPYRAAALQALTDVLGAGVALLAAAEQRVDELRAAAGVETPWDEYVRRAQLRAAAQRAQTAAQYSVPHPVGHTGEGFTSCLYLGLPPAGRDESASRLGTLRPAAAGEHGASRSPTRGGARSQRVEHPRTGRKTRGEQIRAKPPVWASWAYELARALRATWAWLRGVSLARVAATLGARLGPDWTAAAVVGWVRRQRGRGLLDEPAAPLAYLRALLDESLTGLDEPPAAARLHDERRRQLVEDERDELRAAAAAYRRQLDERDAAAAAPDSPARQAAHVVARSAQVRPGATDWRHDDDTANRGEDR